jgi:hypothetical protein
MKNQNPLMSLLVNIIIPVMILRYVTRYGGPHGALIALLLALAVPLGYAIYDYTVCNNRNWMSAVGFVNILITGGLALSQASGFWFSVKEAAMPASLGLAIVITAFTDQPFLQTIFFNPQVMDVDRIHRIVDERQARPAFRKHLSQSTLLFATSFFVSAILNFILARHVFADIPATLSQIQRSEMLNHQLARMTSVSFMVVVGPLLVISGGVMWYLLRGLRDLTGLTIDEIFPNK